MFVDPSNLAGPSRMSPRHPKTKMEHEWLPTWWDLDEWIPKHLVSWKFQKRRILSRPCRNRCWDHGNRPSMVDLGPVERLLRFLAGFLSAWWFHVVPTVFQPLWKNILVSWDCNSHHMGKLKTSNHQPVVVVVLLCATGIETWSAEICCFGVCWCLLLLRVMPCAKW